MAVAADGAADVVEAGEKAGRCGRLVLTAGGLHTTNVSPQVPSFRWLAGRLRDTSTTKLISTSSKSRIGARYYPSLGHS